MKPHLFILLALAAAALAAGPAPAPKPAVAPGEGFKAYKSTRVRNIFDPSRTRDPASDGAPAARTEPGKKPFFALTGTMVQPEEKKMLGFFTGSGSDMNRVLKSKDTIGGYTIRAINVQGAELEKDGASVVLPVGRQIPLEGPNAYTVQPFAPEPPPPSPDSPSSSSSPSSSPPPSSDSRDRDRDRERSGKSERHSDRPPKGSNEDLIRKMMERAQKERTSK
jgi:hypothetical protein